MDNTSLKVAVVVGLILVSILLQGFFGVILLALVAGIVGVCYGLCKKKKRVWKLSLTLVAVILAGMYLFYYLLSTSAM